MAESSPVSEAIRVAAIRRILQREIDARGETLSEIARQVTPRAPGTRAVSQKQIDTTRRSIDRFLSGKVNTISQEDTVRWLHNFGFPQGEREAAIAEEAAAIMAEEANRPSYDAYIGSRSASPEPQAPPGVVLMVILEDAEGEPILGLDHRWEPHQLGKAMRIRSRSTSPTSV